MPSDDVRGTTRLCLALAVLVMLAGAIPGMTGFDHPPQGVNPDEDHFVPSAMRAGNSPTLDPGYYKNPALPVYAYLGWLGAEYGLGRVSGRYGGTDDFACEYLVNPTRFYRWARWLSLAAGLLTAGLLCFGLGRIFDPASGAVSGSLVVCSPLVQSKMHAAIDEPMLLLTASAAMLGLLQAWRTRNPRWLAGAAAMVGLAVGVKFNAAALIVPWGLTAARLVRGGHVSMRRAAAFVLLVPAVLVITTPHLVLSPAASWDHISHSVVRFGEAPDVLANGWTYVRGFGVDFLVPWAFVPVIAGLLVTRRPWDGLRKVLLLDGLLLAAAVVTFLLQGRLAAARYAFPVLPWIVAIAGLSIVNVARFTAHRVLKDGVPAAAVVAVIAGAFLVPGWWQSLDAARGYSRLTARFTLTERMRALCEPGTRYVTDWYGPLLPDTGHLDIHVPGYTERDDASTHVRAHKLYRYLDRGLDPIPEGGSPLDFARLREAGYRYVVMRTETWERAKDPIAHPDLARFLELLEALPPPEEIRHASGPAEYRVYTLGS